MFINEYNLLMLVIVIISYLLGSIPTAYIAARIQHVNIFEIGSGNMGATNVTRAIGLKWGVGVMVFDMVKGMVAIVIALQIKPDSASNAAAMTVAAISVIFGHNWSLFASLLTGTMRGGKGAATAFGTLIIIARPEVMVVTFIIGILIVASTRYVSLGVLTACFLSLFWIVLRIAQHELDSTFLIYTAVVAALLLMRFRENIQRLLTGTERRFGEHA